MSKSVVPENDNDEWIAENVYDMIHGTHDINESYQVITSE